LSRLPTLKNTRVVPLFAADSLAAAAAARTGDANTARFACALPCAMLSARRASSNKRSAAAATSTGSNSSSNGATNARSAAPTVRMSVSAFRIAT